MGRRTLLRLDDILDFDDFIKIRHPATKVHCVCMDDMRLGDNHFIHILTYSTTSNTYATINHPIGTRILRNEWTKL